MSIDTQALIAKIKKQTESFDTVVLKEDEANALVEAMEAAEKRIAELGAITGALKELRPGHITIAGEKIGIYLRDEVDAALCAAGISVKGE